MFYREIYLYKKDTKKVVLLKVKERLDTNCCQVQCSKTFVHVSIMYQKPSWGDIKYKIILNIVHENDNLCSSENGKAHFRYTIWFMISEKVIIRYTFLQNCQQGKQKACVPKFPILSALNQITFMWTCGFYWYEHVYTYMYILI